MLSGVETADNFDLDDLMKRFTTAADSPARPMVPKSMVHDQQQQLEQYSGDGSPTFDPNGFNGADLANTSNSSEWLNLSFESVLGSGSPSSRGSSLETPNLPSTTFDPTSSSIDPTRLKEATADISPMWSEAALPREMPACQPPAFNPPTINIVHEYPEMSTPSRRGHVRKYSEIDTASTMSSKKLRRQGLLPELHIPVYNPINGGRTFQRSLSTGPIVGPNDMSGSLSAQSSPFLTAASPIMAPLSAPAMAQHPNSFNTAVPPNSQPLPTPITPVMPQTAVPGRSYGYSNLATIPEAPSSAPPHVQWMPINADQHQNQNQQQPQQQQQMEFYPQSAQDLPPIPTSVSAPGTGVQVVKSPLMQQHSPLVQAHSLPNTVPTVQVPGLPHHSHSRHSSINGIPTPTMQVAQLPTQNAATIQQMHQQQQQMHMQQMHDGVNLGMGRPIQPPHVRRSSDSELAFNMGSSVASMLRSSSVPQAHGQNMVRASQVFGTTALPPPPPVATYTHQGVVMGQYADPIGQQHFMAPMPTSPPRKRTVTKRVGMCLKPGPKGKVKSRVNSLDPAAAAAIMAGKSDALLHGDGSMAAVPEEPPVPLVPVTVEEFRNAFTMTAHGTLIPNPELDALTERLMYATDENVVDACFRFCYAIGTEYNKAAEKQSKYFKCCFDECAGVNMRVFMRKSAVDSHVRTHVGYRPFKCEADPECDARFVRKHDRDRHVATTHRNEKSFLCTDCGQNFARSDALLRHRAKRDACKARMMG